MIRSLSFALLFAMCCPWMHAQAPLFTARKGVVAQHTTPRYDVDSACIRHIVADKPGTLRVALPTGDVVTLARSGVLATSSTLHASHHVYSSNDANGIVTMVVSPSATIVSIVQGASTTTIGPARDGNGFAMATTNVADAMHCQTNESAVPPGVLAAMYNATKQAAQLQSGRDTIDLRIAVEIDPSLVLATGSNPSLAQTYATSLMAVVDQVFVRDVAIRLRVTSIRVMDSDSTPYPRFGSVFSYIDSAVRYAENNLQDIDRNMMLFLVARGGSGGIAASIGGVCLPTFSYCAADVNGVPVPELPTWSWDASVVAHEIGHVLGAVHTQSCLWPGGPLDSCVTSESGQCVTFMQTRPRIGTLMSYCHQTRSQGGGVAMEFHPRHRTVMRSMAEAAPCLGGAVPVRNSTIVGRITEAVTGRPMQGLQLILTPWNFSYVQGTPASLGDTITVTDADGRYQFTQLGHGLYSIALPATVNRFPVTLSAAQEIAPVIVAADTAVWNLQCVPAYPVSIRVNGIPAVAAMRMHAVYNAPGLSGYASTISYTQEQRNLGIALGRGLPPGQYSFVPVASGYVFDPPIIRVNVSAGSEPIDVQTQATAMPSKGVHATIVTVTFGEGLSAELVPMQTVRLRQDVVDTLLQTDDVGVASIILDTTAMRRSYRALWDTTTWVDATAPDNLINANGNFLYYVNRKRRSVPLVIRPREFEVLQGSYVPLLDEDVIFRPSNTVTGFFGQRITAPFPVRIADSLYSQFWFYANGYLSAGNGTLYDAGGRIVTSFDPAGVVISPLGMRLALVKDSVRTSTVRSNVVVRNNRRWWVVEWNDVGVQYYDETQRRNAVGGSVNFQAWVEEGTGVVEMIYGPMDPPKVDDEWSVEVGMRGLDNFDRLLVEPAADVSLDWKSVGTTTGYVDGITNMRVSPTVFPPSGLIYRFTDVSTSIQTNGGVTPMQWTGQGSEIRLTGLEEYHHVVVYDMMGRIVTTSAINDGVANFSLHGAARGLYIAWLAGSRGGRSAFVQLSY